MHGQLAKQLYACRYTAIYIALIGHGFLHELSYMHNYAERLS